eukprot:TRINITY_DN24112_c0_g1_i1.p1 TRINITY_DN24112_c0_g1~~TRINITY_DN24112_c0_g1_i1.p1  ORF type:complete len:383 (-),score=36.97 TRINITY_DN24112_c0_g1_i1:146-1198(-)
MADILEMSSHSANASRKSSQVSSGVDGESAPPKVRTKLAKGKPGPANLYTVQLPASKVCRCRSLVEPPRQQRGLEESTRTSFLTGHIIWQDRLGKEQAARNKHVAEWCRQNGRTRPSKPDLRKEPSPQDPRSRQHSEMCSPFCVCSMYQTADREFASSSRKLHGDRGPPTPLPGTLASDASRTVPIGSLSRWYHTIGPGGTFSGHGASAAMQQTQGTALGTEAAAMVGESDYQLMCRTMARPKDVGGRKTSQTNQRQGLSMSMSAPSLSSATASLTPAIMPYVQDQKGRNSSASASHFAIRDYLEGETSADPHGMKCALPLRDHELCSQQWRAVTSGDYAAAIAAQKHKR